MLTTNIFLLGCLILQAASITLTPYGEFTEGCEASLECIIAPYTGQMTWTIDSKKVAECVSSYCTTIDAKDSFLTFGFDTTNGVFQVNLDPAYNVLDAKVFKCFDGTNTVSKTVEVKSISRLVCIIPNGCGMGFGLLVSVVGLLWLCVSCTKYRLSAGKPLVNILVTIICLLSICFGLYGPYVTLTYDRCRQDYKKNDDICKAFGVGNPVLNVLGIFLLLLAYRAYNRVEFYAYVKDPTDKDFTEKDSFFGCAKGKGTGTFVCPRQGLYCFSSTIDGVPYQIHHWRNVKEREEDPKRSDENEQFLLNLDVGDKISVTLDKINVTKSSSFRVFLLR